MFVLRRTARVAGAVVLGGGLAFAAQPTLLSELARPLVATLLGLGG
ncbi:hypothetical protein [Cellulomonas sp. S1-8]|nr:hypothetical protein [Cellulomonas sp. S1-8]UZN02994.1 hypothetical protein OKX07_18380 [Cellulomonas sp. S1-8]